MAKSVDNFLPFWHVIYVALKYLLLQSFLSGYREKLKEIKGKLMWIRIAFDGNKRSSKGILCCFRTLVAPWHIDTEDKELFQSQSVYPAFIWVLYSNFYWVNRERSIYQPSRFSSPIKDRKSSLKVVLTHLRSCRLANQYQQDYRAMVTSGSDLNCETVLHVKTFNANLLLERGSTRNQGICNSFTKKMETHHL